MTTRFFCTYFDSRYLPRGIALYRSLERHAQSFRLFVLCLDDVTYDALVRSALPSLSPIRLPDLELFDNELLAARGRRSLVEYYFTITSVLPGYLLHLVSTIDIITYIDSDLLFFASPECLFEELGGGAVALTPHRFAESGLFRTRYGQFNVGWLSWRRDPRAAECMAWYRQKSLEWCYDQLEEDRYADQKYLDEFATRFPGVCTLEHKGANLAPWNNERFRFSMIRGAFHVDEQPLIFYHFHGLKSLFQLDPEQTGVKAYLTGPLEFDFDLLMQEVYAPYIDAMRTARQEVETFGLSASAVSPELRHVEAPLWASQGPPWRRFIDWTIVSGSDALDWTKAWPALDGDRRRALIAQVGAVRGESLSTTRISELLCESAVHRASVALQRPPIVLDVGHPDDVSGRLVSLRPRLAQCVWAVSAFDDLATALPPTVSAPVIVDDPDAQSVEPDLVIAGMLPFLGRDPYARLRLLAGRARWLLIEAHTFSGTPSHVATCREPGRANAIPLWIMNRGDLAFAFRSAGLDVRQEVVAVEPPLRLPTLTEPADLRMFLLERLPGS